MPLPTLYLNDFFILLPMVYVVVRLSVLLMYGSFVVTDSRRQYPVLRSSMMAIRRIVFLMAGILSWNLPLDSYSLMQGRFQIDSASTIIWKILVCFVVINLIRNRVNLAKNNFHFFEVRIIMLLAWVGIALLIMSRSFLTLYLGIELQALSFYILAALRRNSSFRTEAALKYFLLGAFTSGILLFGIALIYRESGRLLYEDIRRIMYVIANSDIEVRVTLITGMSFMLAGMLFKLGAAPFHLWVPDIYEGRPIFVRSFFATVPKIAIVILIIRLYIGPFAIMAEWWRPIILFAALASLTIGTFGALSQSKTKRFLAYRSIGHAGYILLAISSATFEGISAAIFYTIMYMIMASIMWIGLQRTVYTDGKVKHYITDLKGLYYRNKTLAFIFSIGLLSMGGIPPLAGFLAKRLTLWRALETRFILPRMYAVLMAVIAAFYYLRWVKIMFFENINYNNWKITIPVRKAQRLILSTLMFSLIIFIINPQPILILRQRLVLNFFILRAYG